MIYWDIFRSVKAKKPIENYRSGNRNYKYLVPTTLVPTKLIFSGTYIKKTRNLSSKKVMRCHEPLLFL